MNTPGRENQTFNTTPNQQMRNQQQYIPQAHYPPAPTNLMLNHMSPTYPYEVVQQAHSNKPAGAPHQQMAGTPQRAGI
jgi:hypothetical protein